jgi:hypothetical protein
MVRGMIPKTKTSGIEAFKRLRVYIGVPEELRSRKAEFIQDAKITRAPSKYISVGDVAKEIGWHEVLREETKQQPKQDQSLPTKQQPKQQNKKSELKAKQTEKAKAKSQESLSKK